MRDLFLLANELQTFCRRRGWRFCFIGGIALQRWGEPRLTADVDLTILTGYGGEADYIAELCHAFAGRVPDAAELHTAAGCSSFSPSEASPLTSLSARYPSRNAWSIAQASFDSSIP